ncbi:MAG: hypothetical protein ACR2RE_26485 [Geminicoccaceae bacterium]
MPWVAICERLRPNMGRNQDLTYVNVVVSTRQLSGVADAADFVAKNPSHPWADGQFNEFIVDLTDQEASDINDGTTPLFWDGTLNNPRFQQQTAGSGATPSFGSWLDATNSGTAWRANTPIPDNRWIVRIYDDDPVANPAANHLASEEFDEGAAGSSTIRFIRLFTFEDSPTSLSVANRRTEIGGKLIDFDFGSSDGLSAGVARIRFGTDVTGRGEWLSNHRYRIDGPGGEKFYVWQVFGKTLRIVQE